MKVLSVHSKWLFTFMIIGSLFNGGLSQVSAPSMALRAEAISPVIERALPAVVTVEAFVSPNRAIRSSGFVIDSVGWVVGSADGVQNARSVQIYLQDGRVFPARVQGVDNITGLALLQVEGTSNLPSLRWGNSESVPVGATVILIGNRGGMEGSVTTGTLGGKDRVGVRTQTGRVVLLLQFNGPVSSGEPGAPLLDMQGQVIGVIVGSLGTVDGVAQPRFSGGFAPTGFAVPSLIAQRAVNDLRQRGVVEYAYLGIDYQNTPLGVQVARVAPNSPANRAGVMPGDLITGFNGQPVRTSADLTRYLYLARPNQTVELVVLREGNALKLSVTLDKQAM